MGKKWLCDKWEERKFRVISETLNLIMDTLAKKTLDLAKEDIGLKIIDNKEGDGITIRFYRLKKTV